MNMYVKEYLKRGLIFGGFGPIVMGIVYLILELSHVEIKLNGYQEFIAIVTIYICAFVHAGSSVFPQIESWSKIKAMFFQGISIYIVYLFTYLVNRWIPFDFLVIIIYTAAFILGFLAIWLIVYLSTRKLADNINKKLNGGLSNE